MKLKILTMKDTKVGMYIQPFAVMSIAAGTRDLGEAINDANKTLPWQKFPGDFELYWIGDFDGDTGKLEPVEPQFILNLGTLKG